jgi:hypothetical protein
MTTETNAMTTMQVHTRTRTARRTTLALLTGVAVTLGAIAAPLAGTAHAGGASGGVLGDRTAPRSVVGNRSDVAVGTGSLDDHGSKPGGTFETTGRKPGASSGLGV